MKRFITDGMGTYIVFSVKHKAMADDFTPTAGLLGLFALLSVRCWSEDGSRGRCDSQGYRKRPSLERMRRVAA